MFLITFILLFLQWIVLSGRFDVFHLALGVLSCIFIANSSAKLLFNEKNRPVSIRLREVLRFPVYMVWLVYEIIVANFYILYLVFHPKAKDLIKPEIIELDGSLLENDFARVVLAHSITLTPGTITISLKEKVLTIYAINSSPVKGLREMLLKVAWVFNNE